MRYIISLSLLFLFFPFSKAQEISYSTSDSIFIEDLLSQGKSLSDGYKNENHILFYAEKLLDVPYVDATLEHQGEERLIVNMRELDCTTFVETILALSIASETKQPGFSDFVSSLCKIRYKNGMLNGYPSRLHYFSGWIIDNEQLGLVTDVSCSMSIDSLTINVNFMSTHPDSYIHLKDNLRNLQKIKQMEDNLNGKQACYISRMEVEQNMNALSDIIDGDIIAFTTSTEGLDISHVGFAKRVNGVLHLLHASSRHKKVLVDPISLKDYILNGKRTTGIRVIRYKY